jgi:hypothetical protein
VRAEQDQLIRRVRQACVRQAKDKVIEESSTTVGANDRLATPVGSRPIPQLRVDGWAGAGAMLVVVRALVVIAELHDRNEPVPVEHGHVVVEVRRGMPAQKMIVITADFARQVMVAYVVIIGLGQGHVNNAQNQNSDSQSSRTSLVCRPAGRHVVPSSADESHSCGSRQAKTQFAATEFLSYSIIMNQIDDLVKLCTGHCQSGMERLARS